MEEQVKTLLFARWLVTCYSCSELNSVNSFWYKERLEHFNGVVYPEYEKNGSVKEHMELFKTSEIVKGVIDCISYVGVLNEAHAKCEKCGREEWEHKI